MTISARVKQWNIIRSGNVSVLFEQDVDDRKRKKSPGYPPETICLVHSKSEIDTPPVSWIVCALKERQGSNIHLYSLSLITRAGTLVEQIEFWLLFSCILAITSFERTRRFFMTIWTRDKVIRICLYFLLFCLVFSI